MRHIISKAVVAAMAATALSGPAFANTVATNAIQLTTTQAANYQLGVTQGGLFSITGNGLATVNIPTIDADGVVDAAAAAGFTTALNETFSYLGTVRQADIAATGNDIANLHLNAGTFSDLTSKSSIGTGTLGEIAIDAAGVATMNNGAVSGSTGTTTTGIISTTLAGRFSQVENRRVASTSNAQTIVNQDVQQTKFSASGSGIDAVTQGGFNAADGAGVAAGAAGTAFIVDVINFNVSGDEDPTQAGRVNAEGDFNFTHEVTQGQGGEAINVTATDITTPDYGILEYYAGGLNAGVATITDINDVTVDAGGSGTTASLSYIGEMTAFN